MKKSVNKKLNIKKIAVDAMFILVGTLIYAVGLNIFIQPNHLTPGGVTGIAVQLNYLFDLPTGVMTLALNLPLFLFGFFVLGGRFVAGTAFATLCSSVWIDLLSPILPAYNGDLMLVALFGGAISGLGCSLLYLRDSAMGGSDIVATVINKKLQFFSVGKIVLLFNSVVIISAAFVFGNVDSALYSAIAAFVSSKMLDVILLGNDSGKMLFAITEKDPYMIAEEIHIKTGRGATVVSAKGTHSHTERTLLVCVAKKYEYPKINKVIKEADPDAFVVVSEASEVLGKGFKSFVG